MQQSYTPEFKKKFALAKSKIWTLTYACRCAAPGTICAVDRIAQFSLNCKVKMAM